MDFVEALSDPDKFEKEMRKDTVGDDAHKALFALADELEAKDPTKYKKLIERCRNGHYHDFATKVATPKMDMHQDLLEAVENIIHRQLGTDTAREKLNSYISGKIDASLADRSWKTKTFWVPTIISILSLTAVVILSVIYHKT